MPADMWRVSRVSQPSHNSPKSQQTQYTYDSCGDLIQVSRGTVSSGTFTEDIPQRVTYAYGAQGAQNNSAGRVTNIADGPLIRCDRAIEHDGHEWRVPVSGVTYNAANQVLSIAGLSESRAYNANL